MPPILGNTTTTGENAAAPLTGAELVRGVQAGGNVKITTQAIADLGYHTPLTTKGDVPVFNGSNDARLAVGPDGAQLVADSTQALGVKWYDAVGDFVTSLAASAGSALVGFIQAGTGAIARTMQAKARDFVNVLDFGADSLGVTDSTGAFNLATAASATYSSALYRRVDAVGGTYKVGGSNAGIYVRKGQKLHGAGVGATVIDASATGSNTIPTITLGTSSSSVTDSGGQVAEVAGLQFLGGPSGNANIDTSACAGWSIHDVMFSSPGIGVVAGGADGIVRGCLFDDGLNGLVINGANLLVSTCNFYLANYQCTINTGSYDVAITGCQFEYPKYASILLSSGGGAGQKNVMVRDCNFIQNAQFGTFTGAIFIGCNSSDLLVSNSTFRNLNGAGIKYSTGVGNVMVVEGCLFDGNKTTAGYSQSTTMQGIDATNMVATIRGSTFRNLPGQPITFGGGEISTLIVEGCDFSGNTGGTTEINITNSNSASLVIISGCTGSGRPLINSQSTVPVVYMQDNRDGTNTEVTFVAASTYTVGVAVQSVIANFAGTVTLTLPSASIYKNRRLSVRTITANAVVSASSNVSPLAGGAAGTAILSATAGKWASLRSDGTNWQIESAN